MDVENGFGYKFNREENVRRSRRGTAIGRNQGNDVLPRVRYRKKGSRRRTVAKPRKNRPYSNTAEMSLQCCTATTCLLNQGRRVIAIIRRHFDSLLYEDQNTYLCSLIDVSQKAHRKRVTYSIRDGSGLSKVRVCKKAFLKILGIGKKRVAVLLKKIQPHSGEVEKDQRRFRRNERRLPLMLKAV